METGEKVNKTDFWCRPLKPDGTSRYSSDREFRAFQKEDAEQSGRIKNIFNAVFKMSPSKFVEGLEERREKLKAKHKKKIRR
jgi:hypothetical protein